MFRVKLIGALIVALSLVFTYAQPNGMGRNEGVDIRGTITSIRRASSEDKDRFIGTVLVEGDRKANQSLDKANLIIKKETRIFERRDDERRQASFEDLRVGDVVEAKFVEGPTIMIYPLQVAASEIVILNRGRGGK
jgi:hypothetical protein